MKNTFLITGLILALVCVNQIWAQNEPQSTLVERVEPTELIDREAVIDAEVKKSVETDTKADMKAKGISFDINIDDKEPGAESLNRLIDALREIAGEEVAAEVVIELDGMTDREKAELAKSIKKGLNFDRDDVPGWVGVVAILGVILIFGFPILVLISVFVYLARKRRQKMNVIQVYLDAGKDVPAELLNTFDNSGGSFRSGLTLTFVGLGIVAAFNTADEPSIGALGLIPMFIGFAKLLYWYVEERNVNKR